MDIEPDAVSGPMGKVPAEALRLDAGPGDPVDFAATHSRPDGLQGLCLGLPDDLVDLFLPVVGPAENVVAMYETAYEEGWC